jgi:hypothetical protein
MEEGLFSQFTHDHWQHISTFLTVRELCRLMQVSLSWFHIWVTDRCWLYQKQRICSRFPELKWLFDKPYTSKETKTKLKMPRKGTWYVFKKYLALGLNVCGIKKLCKREAMHPLVFAVVSLNIPHHELIMRRKVIFTSFNDRFLIVFLTRGDQFPGNCTTFTTCKGSSSFGLDFLYIKTGKCYYDLELSRSTNYFHSWKLFLFQDPLTYVNWTDLFDSLIQNTVV